MQAVRLSDGDFQAAFVSPMRDITAEGSTLDVLPYLNAISTGELGLLRPLDSSVESVYRSGDARFDHALVSTSAANVYLVIVVANGSKSILGHHILDLNDKYGLKPSSIVSAWRASFEICARHGVEPVAPMTTDTVGIALHTLRKDPLNGLRSRPVGTTAGWYIWGGDTLSTDPDFFSPMHVSHLAQHCPEVLPYLALPPGWRFLLGTHDHVDIWYDEQVLVE